MTTMYQNRPTFINVGPGRSGTSWLKNMLDAHPEIAMAKVKETEYFNSNFARGEEWYLSHFPFAGHAVGEISNMYYLDGSVPERLHDFDPNLRIIFNIREPEALLGSMIGFGVRRGLEVSRALLDEPIGRVMGSGYEARFQAGELKPGDEVPLSQAVLLSRYAAPFLKKFGRDQVYFLVYERIESEPEDLLREIYAFLGVNDDFIPKDARKVVNAAIQPRVRWIGQAATQTANFLRRVGAYSLLDFLHNSKAIKQFFYKSVNAIAPGDFLELPENLLRDLEEERAQLTKLIPELNQFWAREQGNKSA